MSASSSLVVVIPTHGRSELLQRTLESLGACRPPDDFSRLIVVENGGTDYARKIVAESIGWLNACYETHPVPNKSSALNHVLDIVGDELIVFFDDDVRIHEDTLCAYSAAASSAANCFFGGPTDVDYEVAPPEWLKEYLPASAVGWRLDPSSENVDGPSFLGFNWAAHASDLRNAGGFDVRVGPGGTTGARGQEATMQVALLNQGLIGRYVKDALVWHYVPKNRCSEAWALERIYQSGMAQGIRHTSDGPTLFGVPRWMIGDLFRSYLSLANSLARGQQEKFTSRYFLQLSRGRLEGVREWQRRKKQSRATE